MTSVRAFMARLLSLVRARQLDARLDEELRSHLEFATEENLARGMTPEAARAAAIRKVGGLPQTREAWRETRGFPFLTALGQDLRYAVRSYRKTPTFTIVALLLLTLAIGANTTIFSLLNALALRKLPVRDPDRLVQITAVTRNWREAAFTYPMFEELSKQQQVFSSVIGWWGNTIVSAEIDGERTEVFLWAATGNLHAELGLMPAAGRLFLPSDMNLSQPSAEPVAVISSAFWLRQFHGDSSVVGRTIHLEGAPFTILGVTPSEFMGLGVVAEPDVTIPLTAVPLVSSHRPIASIKTSSSQWVHIIGRLKPAVTLQQARAHFDALGPGVLAASVPTGFSLAQRADFLSMHFSVASAATGVEPGLRSEYVTPLAIVLAIAGLVLLIACVNLASLMLARAAARRHEIAVRLALGASPWRVARQVLTEGLLLSLAGGACGLLFAFWGCHAITTLIFEEYLVPVFFDGTPDLRVTGITTAIALAVGALFSLAPMWCVWRERSAATLQQNSRTTAGTGHVGRLLVAAQTALSLVLLANAGLLVRSLSEVRSIESGISRTDGVFVAYPGPVPGGYDHLDSDVYYQEVLQRISALPGVSRASASLLKPATSGPPRSISWPPSLSSHCSTAAFSRP
jgi:predicted permease